MSIEITWDDASQYGYVDGRHVFEIERHGDQYKVNVLPPEIPRVKGSFRTIEEVRQAAEKAARAAAETDRAIVTRTAKELGVEIEATIEKVTWFRTGTATLSVHWKDRDLSVDYGSFYNPAIRASDGSQPVRDERLSGLEEVLGALRTMAERNQEMREVAKEARRR